MVYFLRVRLRRKEHERVARRATVRLVDEQHASFTLHHLAAIVASREEIELKSMPIQSLTYARVSSRCFFAR